MLRSIELNGLHHGSPDALSPSGRIDEETFHFRAMIRYPYVAATTEGLAIIASNEVTHARRHQRRQIRAMPTSLRIENVGAFVRRSQKDCLVGLIWRLTLDVNQGPDPSCSARSQAVIFVG